MSVDLVSRQQSLSGRWIRVVLLIVLAAGLLAVVGSARSAAPATKRSGLIAFLRGDELKRRSLFTVRADGGGERRLTGQTVGLFAWSPDGKRIAVLQSPPGHDTDLYVTNADGSQQLRILRHRDMDHLSWSPDGRRIAFLTWNLRDDGQGGLSVPSHLWVIDRDGSNLHEVLTGQTLNGIGRPLWSPDGRRFLFTARPDWVDTIFVVDADGGNLRRVVQPTLKQVNSLAWLPDGRILYQEESLDGSRSEISLINADGSGQRVLVRNAGRAGPVYANYSDPAISPDGKTIAYLVHRHAGATWQPPEIYLMNSDGTAQHKLPHGGTQLGPIAGPYLSWSPDGKKIAFTARAGGTHEIYVIGADGKNRQRLTRNNQDDAAPAWQPRPGK